MWIMGRVSNMKRMLAFLLVIMFALQVIVPTVSALDVSCRAIKARESDEYSPETAWDLGYTGEGINIAILAVPEDSAQTVTDLLVDSGIRVIINYTSIPIKVPGTVDVETNDPIEKLLHTLYYLSNTVYTGYN